MKNIRLTARKAGGECDYLPLRETGLSAGWLEKAGSGAANDPWICALTIWNAGEAPWEGVIRLSLPFESAMPRFFLPGFMYGTNRGEAPLVSDSKSPRLRHAPTEFPASPWWLTRSDRLSHPVALAFTGSRVTGLCASPYTVLGEDGRLSWSPGISGDLDQYAGFGCDIDRCEVCYTLGYENAPWFFLESHHIEPRSTVSGNAFRLEAGEVFSIDVAVFDYPAGDARGINGAVRWAYRRFHESPREGLSVRAAVEDIATAVSRDAWLEDSDAYAGFVFDWQHDHEGRRLPSISWTNGMAVAVPMLQAAHRLEREDMRAQALRCIDHVVNTSINPGNGLPFTAEVDGVWSNRGWWYDRQPVPGHAAYLVGQALYYILKAYALEKGYGVEHRQWLAYVEGVLEIVERTRNGDGEYPYVFSEDSGAGLCYDSMSGAWCLAAAAYHAVLTGDRRRLSEWLKSEAHYHAAFIAPMVCYGGPLDIDKQVDSEGVLACIRALRWLHELTGDEQLLSHMGDAMEYEFTFKFCYNSPIKVPPLSRVGWSSCGGSITSVTNPHIHPMSSTVADEILYYVQRTGDEYVNSRLLDTVNWSRQVSSRFDGEYDYGKRGWMSERFCHCEGLLTERYPDGSPASTWFALMPWACGCILEALTGDIWGR